MERGRHQHAGEPHRRELFQIDAIAHAAGGEDSACAGALPDCGEALEIGSGIAADASQGHDDDAPGPESGVGLDLRRPDEPLAAIVEREDAACRSELPQGGGELSCRRQGLAAQHRDGAGLGQRERRIGGGDAAIDPEREVGMAAREVGDDGLVTAVSGDGVEIGNVEAAERRQRQQALEHGDRRGARRQWRRDRPILCPLAGAGMDHLAGFEIEHRNDRERAHRTLILRIFAWEYVTAGGWREIAAPASAIAEGRLMLHALLRDLGSIPGVEVVVATDPALPIESLGATTVAISPDDLRGSWAAIAARADAVWPIAPETGGMLEAVVEIAGAAGAAVLASGSRALAIARSKTATSSWLAAHGIPVVATAPVFASPPAEAGWVVKPDDGTGAADTRFVGDGAALARLAAAAPSLIAQPYLRGEPLSLSLLAQEGEAWLLSCNRQDVSMTDGVFAYRGSLVGGAESRRAALAPLAQSIAAALPELWGYIGVDLVDGEDGPVVLEINPRLTTSYAGLARSIGVNPAALVLGLRERPLRTLMQPLAVIPVAVEVPAT